MAAHERFAAATPATVEAIVAGIGDFAAEVYAPLNRAGDTNQPKWNDGRVTMPSGFQEAYRQFVAAGWGSIDGPGAYGGQDQLGRASSWERVCQYGWIQVWPGSQ